MTKTTIEWSEEVWNPVTGCTKVSPGCDHCYAERVTERFHGKGSFDRVVLHPERLDHPLRWRRDRLVFVNSMSDLFHDDVPDDFIARVLAVIAATPHHTYQLLTKRHGRMRSLLSSTDFWLVVGEHATDLVIQRLSNWRDVGRWWRINNAGWDQTVPLEDRPFLPPHPLPNLWLGVSVEDQKWANVRISALLTTPAAVRFLSCEPLLGPVDLRNVKYRGDTDYHLDVLAGRYSISPIRGHGDGTYKSFGLAKLGELHWVIVGGESGPGARPMHPEWARSLRDQCDASRVPFFFKQAGRVLAREWGCSDRKGGTPDEWPEPFPRELPLRSEVPA